MRKQIVCHACKNETTSFMEAPTRGGLLVDVCESCAKKAGIWR